MKRGLAFKGPAKQGGWISFAFAAVSAISGAVQGRKARKNQRRANEAQREANRIKNFQAKRQFLRNFRQAQAANLTASVAAGVGIESSRTQGTRGSQLSQAATASYEFDRMDKLGEVQAANLASAARRQAQAANWGSVSNLALSFASLQSNTSSVPTGTKIPSASGQGSPGFGNTPNNPTWQIGGIGD